MEGESEDPWVVGSHGMKQLHELNAMERNQDHTKWLLAAILLVSNSVLVASFFQLADRYMARLCVAGLGFVVSLVWLLVSQRVHVYERLWIGRAKELERKIGISPEFRVWDDNRPPGIPGRWIILFGALIFIAFWVVGSAYSLYHLM